jgi:hypothetical protein
MGSISGVLPPSKSFSLTTAKKVICKHFLYNFNRTNKPFLFDLTKNFFSWLKYYYLA